MVVPPLGGLILICAKALELVKIVYSSSVAVHFYSSLSSPGSAALESYFDPLTARQHELTLFLFSGLFQNLLIPMRHSDS